MGTELFIKSQGFPEILKKLGVQSPLQGNFWTLTSEVHPTYLLGADPNLLTTNTFRYPFNSFDQVITATLGVNPLVDSGDLERALYAFRIHYSWSNLTTTRSRLDFIVRDPLSATIKNIPLCQIEQGNGTTVRAVGQGFVTLVEEIPTQGFSCIVQNLNNLATSEHDFNVFMAWDLLGPLNP